ncbi:MAG: sugar phosphate isomerase/epimerase [Candidatus Omnitrophota bacterium]
MPLLLSTSWNAFRHTSGKELIFEIKKTGFQEVELSFNLTSQMVKEIAGLVKAKKIKVGSLHNYCPIPNGLERRAALPDCYSMSSTDEKQRQLAIRYTKRTIRTAAALDAKAVVLHTGRTEICDNTRQLMELYDKGLKNSLQFKRIKRRMTGDRKKQVGAFLNSTLKSLEELGRYAEKLKIKLGVENRVYYREIPGFKEVGAILERFKDGNIYYWHDTGHAQIMENLGFAVHREYLDAYGKYMLGMHIHNVRGCKDHQPPHKGDIDLKILKPYVKAQTIKVIEAHHPATAQELIKSRQMLAKMFNEK